MEATADVRAFEALSQHPRLSDLAAMTRAVMSEAAEARKADRDPARVAALAEQHGLTREDAATPFGNALDVLERGPEGDAERALACGLAGHAVAASTPAMLEDDARFSGDLLWLATHTPFDATGLVDRALGDGAPRIWEAVAERVRRIDLGTAAALGRGEALVGAAALVGSSSAGATKAAAGLARDVKDSKVARVLTARAAAEAIAPVAGELAPAPRRAVWTALLGMTGLLLVAAAARGVGRLALGYRRPAQITLAEGGAVRVTWHTEMLGRKLRDHDVLVPRAGLARATRDVRYPGLPLYAGLLALAVGSAVGVSTFVDGARASSPSLLVSGLVIVALGLAIDFALTSLVPAARGRCRVLVVSRDGTRVCVGGLALARADELLARLSKP
jgi:hypothetical protein